MNQLKSRYIVFSAPSGAGKTTIIKLLLKEISDLALSVSATTRAIRPGETDGKDYYFMQKKEFEKAIQNNQFLEYEEVHGNYYGTLKDKVHELVSSGKSVVFDIDVKGAQSIKNNYPEAILIFVKPPSKKILEQRLIQRKSEDQQSIKLRLERLDYEYKQAVFFDFEIVNDHLDQAVQQIKHLIFDN